MKKQILILLSIFSGSLVEINAQSLGVNHPATDGLGRRLPAYEEVGDVRPNKTVAMFHTLWPSEHASFRAAYDLSKILDGHPEMVNDYNHPGWAPYEPQNSFFWGEPLFGFYSGLDQWVLRKQLEMLGSAGVDVLVYDASNYHSTFKSGYEAMGAAMAQARADGVDVPQFAFLLNFAAIFDTGLSLDQLYDDLYSVGLYQDSWFMWDGKPVIMAYPEALDIDENQTAGLKFTASSPFTGIQVRCPSWNDSRGNLTLSLYNWQYNYSYSVSQSPLASQTFVDFNDNAYLSIEFGQRSAGNYVWELSDATGVVGVWKYTDDASGSESYLTGNTVSGGYQCQINYSGFYTDLTSGSSFDPQPILGTPLASEKISLIKNFFTFRPGQPKYEGGPTRDDQWGWLENAPQNGYGPKPGGGYEFMTVGVAQNWSEDTDELSAMNGPNIHGRSYTQAGGFSQLTDTSYLQGYNFQEQWDRALLVDPDMVFITGWNEWEVGRYEVWMGVTNGFPDQFDNEYSRGIEPMKGGSGDHYYYQMIANIRKYKGMEKPVGASPRKMISIDGAFAEWADVKPFFVASRGNVLQRDSDGYIDPDSPTGEYLHYVDGTGRNDVVGSKIACDEDSIYFYVKGAATLTSPTDARWMQLFIDLDREKETGWEGYDFVIDQYAADGTASLKKSSNGWNWTEVGRVEFEVVATEMEIAIPRILMGVQSGEGLDLEFKWMDNVNPSSDIMEVYTSGDVAPNGRFNYRYLESSVVLNDTFNSGLGVATNDVNYNLGGRQSGLAAPGAYLDVPEYDNELTANGELRLKVYSAGAGWEYMTGNLAPSLADKSFSIKLEGKLVEGAADAWSSFCVLSATDDSRDKSPLGFFIHQQLPNHAGDILYIYSGTPAGRTYTPITVATLVEKLGATYSVYDLHTYEFRASAASSTHGTYDFCVDGVVVLAQLAYEFGDATLRKLEWVNTGVESLWDNLNISTIPMPATAPPYVFIDTFDIADTSDINADLETRQAEGIIASAPYTLDTEGYGIVGGKLHQNTAFKWIWQESNLAGHIDGKDFEFSAKITTTETGLDWTEIYLFGDGENQDTSRFAVLVQGAAADNACIFRSGTGPAIHEEFITVTEVEAASGVPYIRNAEHTFQLISTAGTGGTNTCTLVVDGFTMRSGIEYFISGSDNIRMGWVKTSSADVYYDDVYVKLKGIAYAEWADEKGLSAGVNDARSDDPDRDGMNNLTEYALGGDPLLDDASSILPTFEIMDAGGGSNFMDYVYNRRLDAADRGLTYGLNMSEDLQSEWIYVGNTYETGSSGIDSSFESVSNSISVSGLKGFVNLEIVEE